MKPSLGLIILTMALLLLSACSIIEPIISPIVDVYTLSPVPSNDSQEAENKTPTIVVAFLPIRGARSLMSTDIVYRESEYSFDSYAYSRWSDNPSKLLDVYLQQRLSNDQLVSTVVPYEIGADSEMILQGELLDFSHHVQNNKSSAGIVKVHFYLLDASTKSIVANRLFSAEEVADPKNAKGATAAINRASAAIAEQLIIWLMMHAK